ncbi:phosphatase 1J [Pelobates cultripes]|uniref:Phosphatase 1J n=1 Tax=Pelobates cultripes TaxID=61616 RepID=A0AAD1VJ54_PELCU|nr:phosphatase 1J [Pelobates cultripes]
MISKVRAAMTGLVGSKSTKQSIKPDVCQQDKEPPKTEIPSPRVPCRPGFLSLTPEELQASEDHTSRIILSPKNPGELHWGTGYAEVVNAGKSLHNEDQACCEYITVEMRDGKSNDCLKEFPESGQSIIQKQESLDQVDDEIGFSYWGLFDGHAGCGCAMFAAKLLHFHICDQLRDLVSILRQSVATPAPLCLVHDTTENAAGTPKEKKTQPPLDTELRFHLEKQVFPESLVIGALENAFREMDKQIETERTTHKIDGGCCALVAVHLMGKIYVANAGDSRAIIIRQGKPIPMSQEFTPETERQRVQFLGFLKPELLGNEFTCLEFPRRIQQKELKKRMLYRDHTMTGWAYKTIVEDDMKFPLIYGEGKKARVMATIGVTRGLGDHDLKVYNSNIYIKPFLSCAPGVRVYDLSEYDHDANDVMVMGTDGLWDVIKDEEVADIVQRVFASHDNDDQSNRYSLVAKELVLRTRGVLKENSWRLASGSQASVDDISVFVIPLAEGHRSL